MALLLNKPAILGNTVLQGQVLVCDIDGAQFAAPSKKLPWWKAKIDAVIPEAPPNVQGGDVRWMTHVKYYVIAVFPDSPYDVDAMEKQPERPS